MPFNFPLGECAIWRVQVYQDGLKLNGTHRIMVYVDDVYTLGGSVHTIKKNTTAWVVAGKEIGQQINADKAKYVVMSRDENAERSHITKIENSTFERMEQLKYLGTTLTNQNSVQEEIKSRMKSGNACYHMVQNRLQFAIQQYQD